MFNFLLPRCERCHKKLGPTHDVKECARATRSVSRRFFLGVSAGLVAATAAGVELPTLIIPANGVPIAIPKGPSTMDLISMQIEKVRPRLAQLFESSEDVARMIREANGDRITVKPPAFRFPLRVA